jgi:hypothetical protein
VSWTRSPAGASSTSAASRKRPSSTASSRSTSRRSSPRLSRTAPAIPSTSSTSSSGFYPAESWQRVFRGSSARRPGARSSAWSGTHARVAA